MEKTSYFYEKRRFYLDRARDNLDCLPNYCTEFINDKLASTKFQPSTCYAYSNDLKMFFEYLVSSGQPFENCDPKDISLEQLNSLTYRAVADYLSYLTTYNSADNVQYSNEAASKARKLSAIRSLFAYLTKHHMVTNNPCLGVDMPKAKEKPVIKLDSEERAAYMNSVCYGTGLTKKQRAASSHMKLRDETIVSIFLGTGIRVSELVGLDIDDINELKQSLMVSRKGGKVQNVYMGPNLYDLLMRYIKEARPHLIEPDNQSEEKALFLSARKQRITVRSVEILVKKYADASLGSGNKISPHKMRSTYGTNLYESSGGDINMVADALGHSDIKTSSKFYVDIGEQHRKSAGLLSDISESP